MAKPSKAKIKKARAKDGGGNAYRYPNVAKGNFAGKDDTYPMNTEDRARSALRLAFHAGPDAAKRIKAKVYKKYPGLKPSAPFRKKKRGGSRLG